MHRADTSDGREVRMNDDAHLRVEYVKLPACDGRAAEAGEQRETWLNLQLWRRGSRRWAASF